MPVSSAERKIIPVGLYLIVKRVFDFILSLISFIILLPVMLIIALLVFIETKRNPIFIQERGLSLTKRRFKIIKFRTILNNTPAIDKKGEATLRKSEFKSHVGPLGSLLRRKGLDELPQLLNILKGDMSFIGLRPLSIDDLNNIKNDYPDLYSEREKLDIPLGLSGLWQLNKDENFSIIHLINMEKIYFEKRSFLFDLKLLSKSINISFSSRHKDSIVS